MRKYLLRFQYYSRFIDESLLSVLQDREDVENVGNSDHRQQVKQLLNKEEYVENYGLFFKIFILNHIIKKKKRKIALLLSRICFLI